MNNRLFLHIIAPTILISILLFGLGVAAAWNVRRQQATSSDVIVQEMHSMQAAQELLLIVPELRHLLEEHERTGDREQLAAIVSLEPRVNEHIAAISKLARTSEEQAIIEELSAGCQEFFKEVHALLVTHPPILRDARLDLLLDNILRRKILAPAKAYVNANREVVDRTAEANRHTATQMRQAFLLLGICGGAAGLVAGLAIARGIGRSMFHLNVFVQATADKLSDVVGPVSIATIGGFNDLEDGLRQVEEHIGNLILRLRQRELEILRQQQLAAVGQLAAGLAHELRNPLMPMKMLVQKALAQPDGPGMTRRQLTVIHEEIHRLEKLIQEFLEFAKPQVLHKRVFDVRPVVSQALELVATRARVQNVALYAELPEETTELEADPVRLQQVFLNLLLNSLDMQNAGGSITVAVSEIPATDSQPSRLRIRVSDAGPGIPPELLPRIFEPFVSTKETGIGLGLTISQRIVEDHGGTLQAFNNPAGGAVFEMFLDRAECAQSASLKRNSADERNGNAQTAGH